MKTSGRTNATANAVGDISVVFSTHLEFRGDVVMQTNNLYVCIEYKLQWFLAGEGGQVRNRSVD